MDRTLFQITDVFAIEGLGTIASGKVTDGVLRKGMKAIINGKESQINSVEASQQTLESAPIGASCAIRLSNIKKQDIQIGATYSFQ